MVILLTIRKYEDIVKMDTEDIKLEMLQIWHEVDFNILTEEETEIVKLQLKLYREILMDRHYNFYKGG